MQSGMSVRPSNQERRRTWCWGVLAAAALLTTAPVVAQSLGGGQGAVDGPQSTEGQWSGPWDLAADMQHDEQGSTYSPLVKEIAHAFIVPPASPAESGDPAYGGMVVFINQRGISTTSTEYPTFLWDPADPGMVKEHLIVSQSVAFDMFCSGHTYLGDGRPFTAGGQDHTQGGNPGQGKSFVLRSDLAGPGAPPFWEELGNTATERWYPTATTLHDGRVLQTGATPNCGTCPIHSWCCGDPMHQIFDPTTSTWGSDRPNERYEVSVNCTSADELEVLHYPRLHLLASGELMWADAKADGTDAHAAWFLPADDSSASADCTVGPDPHNQWRLGTGDQLGLTASQKGAPTVHILWPDPMDPTSYHEVVYQFGGLSEPHDDGGGCPAEPLATEYPPTRVVRMQDPNWMLAWQDCVPDMPEGRVNHNAVLLLDGSIFIVGGVEPVGSGACEFRTTPILLKPDEVFGDASSCTATFADMAVQTGLRQYHSVAGLLPDGRVFSAGGAEPGNTHTVELWRPPYLFMTPRPEILTTFTASWSYGATVQFDVKLRNGNEIDRIALVRPCSVTHAFDMSQRYITLPMVGAPVDLGNGEWRVTVLSPPDGFVAPPGWYMLTAVSEGLPIPSRGRWVKLES